MTEIETIIKQRIGQHGPMSVGEFMMLSLCHPKYGYYITRDPIGAKGDFITAPEISQIFGELIAVWIIDKWKTIGSPKKFTLLECGPGRGTLMDDILRVLNSVEDISAAMNISLLDASPILKQVQKDKLAEYDNIQWIDDIKELSQDLPLIVIGNEFFDALPVEQLVKVKDKWAQKVISIDEEANFIYGLREIPPALKLNDLEAKDGDMFEIAPVRANFMHNLCDVIKKNTGAALFIDYGHFKTAIGDTLQAVIDHKYTDLLTNIGNADITSHVDFEVLANVAFDMDIDYVTMQTQRDFLYSMGLKARASALLAVANDEQKIEIEAAVKRLSEKNNDDMGELFKVIEVYNDLQ